jgi:hypothetical protein
MAIMACKKPVIAAINGAAVDRLGHRRQRPRKTRRVFGEFLHSVAVFERQAVRIQKVEKHAVRRDVPAWSKHDRNPVSLEPVDRAADVVDLRHHEIHVVQPVVRGAPDADAVVVRVRRWTHERDHTLDVVGGREAQHLLHERDGLRVARRPEYDVTQTLDLGHCRNEGQRPRRDWCEAELHRRAHVRLGHSYDPRKASPRTFLGRRLLERDVVTAQPLLKCVG